MSAKSRIGYPQRVERERSDPILKRLFEERVGRRMSLEEMALWLDMSKSAVCRLETGSRAVTLADLRKWAAYFGLRVELVS